MKNKIIVGMIEGRHNMPVTEYIFKEGEIKDVHDYDFIAKQITKFVKEKVGIHCTYGIGLNQLDSSDVKIFEGEKILIVYVTGLTPVTAELIRICALYGVRLTLMNFDTSISAYKEQVIF